MARLDELLTGYGTAGIGTTETAATLLSGMLADIPAGLGGGVEYLKRKVKGERDAALKAAERVEQLRDKFTYLPRTEAGKAGLGYVGNAFEKGIETLKKTPGTQQIQADWEKATGEAPAITAAMAGLAAVVDPTKGAGRAGRAAKTAERAAEVAKTAERAAQVAPHAAVPEVRAPVNQNPVDLRATVVREPLDEEIARLQARMQVLTDGGVSKRSPTVVKVRREIEQLQKKAKAGAAEPQPFDVPPGKTLTPGGLVDDPQAEARAAQRAQRATELAAERAAKAEKRAAREAEVVAESQAMRADPANANVPEAILGMGASKAAREASASRRAVEEAERKAAETGEEERVVRTAEERAAVPQDLYRQLYKEKGEQAVFDAAQRGEHMRRGPGGELIGFPRDVRTMEDVGRMRNSLDEQLMNSLGAIRYAEDPKRVGNWYERAQQGILETTEPKLLDRTLEAEALHSQGVDPTAQTIFANRYLQSRGLGKPMTGFYGRQAALLDDARARGEKAKLAFKVGEYRNKLDAREDQLSPSGVNDFRAAQTYGYTDAAGQPWTAGVSPTMHPVMDAENALTVLRARMAGVPGMTGALVQELPWVLGKSEDLLLRGLHKGDTPLESRVNALREANKTGADTAFDQAGSATLGLAPGLDTGIDPRTVAPNWTRAANEADPHARDILLSATEQRHFPPTMATGEWMGATEPNVVNRPLVYAEAGTGKPAIAPDQLAALKALEVHRGLAGGQSAVALNFPDTKGTGRTDVLLERKGMNRYGNPEAQMPSADEMVALNAALTGRGYFAVPTQRGALLKTDPSSYAHTPEELRFGPQRPPEPEQLLRNLRAKKRGGDEAIEKLLPGSRLKTARDAGFYEPVTPPLEEMGAGIGTSRWLNAMAQAPEAVAQKVGSSKEARDVLKTHIRGVQLGQKKGLNYPEPMMKTLQFMAGKDWPKVVSLMKKGTPIAAAMGAYGHSLQGMAAEDLQRIEAEEKGNAK